MIDLARWLTEAEHRLRDRPDVIFGDAKSRRVWIDEVELSPEASWTLRIHSPDGFNWAIVVLGWRNLPWPSSMA